MFKAFKIHVFDLAGRYLYLSVLWKQFFVNLFILLYCGTGTSVGTRALRYRTGMSGSKYPNKSCPDFFV
jgi:hypothetical protein